MLSWLKVQAHVFFPEFPSAKGLRMDAECCQQRVRNGPQSFFLGRSVGPAGCFKQATRTTQTVGAHLRPQPTYTQQTSQQLLPVPASEGRGHGAGSIPKIPPQGQGCSRHEAEGPGPGTSCDSSWPWSCPALHKDAVGGHVKVISTEQGV